MTAAHRSVAEIEAEIAKHRAQLSASLNTLQHKLSIDGAIESVKSVAAQNAGDLSAAVSKTVRSNPLAVALIGAGLVLLASGQGSSRSNRQKRVGTRAAKDVHTQEWHADERPVRAWHAGTSTPDWQDEPLPHWSETTKKDY